MATENDLLPRLLRLKSEIRAAEMQSKLAQLAEAVKYDPDQPRVPAGNPNGGQWTSGGGGGANDPENAVAGEGMSPDEIIALSRNLGLVAGGRSYQFCLNLCYPLLERFSPLGTTNINKWDFVRCMNACLGK